ncbi:hypothetical protein J6590_004852 [Homalodisca vitripennis]|nr:hypothetical protein J6590_004852 [Homalodisca vitripennis]
MYSIAKVASTAARITRTLYMYHVGFSGVGVAKESTCRYFMMGKRAVFWEFCTVRKRAKLDTEIRFRNVENANTCIPLMRSARIHLKPHRSRHLSISGLLSALLQEGFKRPDEDKDPKILGCFKVPRRQIFHKVLRMHVSGGQTIAEADDFQRTYEST